MIPHLKFPQKESDLDSASPSILNLPSIPNRTRLGYGSTIFLIINIGTFISSFFVKGLVDIFLVPIFILGGFSGIYGSIKASKEALTFAFWDLTFYICTSVIQLAFSIIFKTPIFMSDAELLRRMFHMRVSTMWPFVLLFIIKFGIGIYCIEACVGLIKEISKSDIEDEQAEQLIKSSLYRWRDQEQKNNNFLIKSPGQYTSSMSSLMPDGSQSSSINQRLSQTSPIKDLID